MAKKKITKTPKTSVKKKKASARPLRKKVVTKRPTSKKVVKKTVASKPAAKKKGGELTKRDKKLQEIKKKLICQKELILQEAEQALNSLPGQIVFPDLGDQATAETDRNFMLRLRSREQKLLKKIEEAIERIDSGTFGICDDCGMDIDIRRLEARPVTTLCIECKTQQEEEERMREI